MCTKVENSKGPHRNFNKQTAHPLLTGTVARLLQLQTNTESIIMC